MGTALQEKGLTEAVERRCGLESCPGAQAVRIRPPVSLERGGGGRSMKGRQFINLGHGE